VFCTSYYVVGGIKLFSCYLSIPHVRHVLNNFRYDSNDTVCAMIFDSILEYFYEVSKVCKIISKALM